MIKREEITIRKGKGRYQPKIRIIQNKNAANLWKIAVFLFSTFFALFHGLPIEKLVELKRGKSKTEWIVLFLMCKNMEMLLHLGRSPPSNLDFQQINQDWRNEYGRETP